MVQLDLLPLHCWASLHWRVCSVVLVVDLWKTLEWLKSLVFPIDCTRCMSWLAIKSLPEQKQWKNDKHLDHGKLCEQSEFFFWSWDWADVTMQEGRIILMRFGYVQWIHDESAEKLYMNVTAELCIMGNRMKIEWKLFSCLVSFGLIVLSDEGPETFVWVNPKGSERFREIHGTRPTQRFFNFLAR